MSKDQYRYFRLEARELIDGLAAGMLELEKGDGPGVIDRMFRLAHTIKGAARVVRLVDIADHAHALESLLLPARDTKRRLTREEVETGLQRIDLMRAGLQRLEAPASDRPPAEAPAPLLAADTLRGLRIDPADADALLDGIMGVSSQLAAALHHGAQLGQTCQRAAALAGQLQGIPAAASRSVTESQVASQDLASHLDRVRRELVDHLERAERGLLDVQALTQRMRLVPVGALFGTLERTLRDTSRLLEWQVRWHAEGGEIGIESAALDQLSESLPHLVRNAVGHGIESPGDRANAGKPREGMVRLAVRRQGDRVVITCADDGRGIDVAAIRKAARENGRIGPHHPALTDDTSALRLLLNGGITTSTTVTPVSGRGVGLDVVRVALERLGGTIDVHSRPGNGTTFELRLPASLSSMHALLVESGGCTVAIPLEALERTLRVPATAIIRSADGDSILIDEVAVPFLPLAVLLGRDGAPGRSLQGQLSVVLLHGDSGRAALGVDRLGANREVAIRPMPPGVVPVPCLLGTAVDEVGTSLLVLDGPATIPLVGARHIGGAAPPAPIRRLPVLVIDDSLTTRTLEQSIIESAGYEVDVAVSAEEALAKAARRAYGLFVVDVEMPGMNGFEFVATTRAHPEYSGIPAILVTSRDAPEDRQRGRDVGAIAYLIKAEFDQVRLLSLIRDALGSR